jgi:hypothetical protein
MLRTPPRIFRVLSKGNNPGRQVVLGSKFKGGQREFVAHRTERQSDFGPITIYHVLDDTHRSWLAAARALCGVFLIENGTLLPKRDTSGFHPSFVVEVVAMGDYLAVANLEHA